MKAWVKGAIVGLVIGSIYYAFWIGTDSYYQLTNYEVVKIFAISVTPFIILGGIFSFVREGETNITYSKILFYLAIIVIYFLFLEFFYDFGSKTYTGSGPGTLRSLGLGDYLWKYSMYFSWFIIAVLAYFSRNRFDGMMISFAIWTPWVIWGLVPPRYHSSEFAAIAIGVYLYLTILGAAVGIVFGFIGSKRKIRGEKVRD